MEQSTQAESYVKRIAPGSDSDQVLDESNDHVFLVKRSGGTGFLVLLFIRFGFDIDETLEQVEVAHSDLGSCSLVAGIARGTPRRRVIETFVLGGGGDFEFGQGPHCNEQSGTLVAMDEIGEAEGARQCLF